MAFKGPCQPKPFCDSMTLCLSPHTTGSPSSLHPALPGHPPQPCHRWASTSSPTQGCFPVWNSSVPTVLFPSLFYFQRGILLPYRVSGTLPFLAPPAHRLPSGSVEQMVGGTSALVWGDTSPRKSTRARTWICQRPAHSADVEDGGGERAWGFPGIGSSGRPNPDRGRRVAQPRDQSCIPMSAAAPAFPRKREVSRGCGETLWAMAMPGTPSRRCSSPTNKGLLEVAPAPRGAETPPSAHRLPAGERDLWGNPKTPGLAGTPDPASL